MDTSTTISRITANDRPIYEAIVNTIVALKANKQDGDNMSLDDLTTEVANSIDMPTSQLRPFVSHIARQVKDDGLGRVSNGRCGGFIFGPCPEPKPKRAKKVEATEVATIVDTETTTTEPIATEELS